MRHTISVVAFIFAFLASPIAMAEDKNQFPDASETTPELIELWEETNGACRSASGSDVTTWAACAARSVYGTALNERNQCFGHEDEAEAAMQWHTCDAKSLRFKPVDISTL